MPAAYWPMIVSVVLAAAAPESPAALRGREQPAQYRREPDLPRAPAPQDRSRGGGGFTCGTRTYCTEMRSCAEAQFHFRQCGLRRLDGDRDGIPCERLCGGGR